MEELPFNKDYSVTKDGKIYSNRLHRFLKLQERLAGRKYITLKDDNGLHSKQVSFLVASTYIPNTNNYRYVKHINGDFSDDRVKNLEWSKTIERKFNRVSERSGTVNIEKYKTKKIKDYEDLYLATSCGKIYSLRTRMFLKQKIQKTGYHTVTLYDRDKKQKCILVHRLIAQTFITNPNNKPCVNHKDGNKLNNCVDNLEWCTSSENATHAHDTNLKKRQKSHGCIQYDKNGIEVARYENIIDAVKATGAQQANISRTCKGITNTAGGWKWKYLHEDINEEMDKKIAEGWKTLEEFPEYFISEEGKVWSSLTNKLLTARRTHKNYYQISLIQDGKTKTVSVHRLVAYAYIPNPNNYNCIRHIDGDPENNHYMNLEWCNKSTVVTESRKLKQHKDQRKVQQYTLNDEFIAEFYSFREAARGIGKKYPGQIGAVCIGKAKTAYGFKWRYAEV